MNKPLQIAECFLFGRKIEREKEWESERKKKEERKGGNKEKREKERERKKEKVAKEGPLYLLYMPSLETLKAIKGDSSSLARELDII